MGTNGRNAQCRQWDRLSRFALVCRGSERTRQIVSLFSPCQRRRRRRRGKPLPQGGETWSARGQKRVLCFSGLYLRAAET
jgi:hypothetical protein